MPMRSITDGTDWKTIERKENPTLSVDFPCADYGKVFLCKENGAVLSGAATYHTFTRSLDVSTEGHIIAFFMANSRPFHRLHPQNSTMKLGPILILHRLARCILSFFKLGKP